MATVNKRFLDVRPIVTEDSPTLPAAFSKQDGEKGPRVSIEKDGRSIDYNTLRDMRLEELMLCKISLMGCHLEFEVGEPKLGSLRSDYRIPATYDCIWCGPDTARTTGHKLETSALEIMEEMYQKVVHYISS
jgi:hypothetical protein